MNKCIKWLTLGMLVLMTTAMLVAQTELIGRTISTLNVRSGAGEDYAVITLIDPRMDVIVEGRNRVGNWLLIRTPDGVIRGWVASRYITWSQDYELANLPILDEVIGGASTSSSPQDNTETAPQTTQAIGNSGTSITLLNVRIGNGTGNTLLGQIPVGSAVTIEARNTGGDWLLVNSGTLRGWVASRYIDTDIDTLALPVSAEIIGVPSAQTNTASTNGGVPLSESDTAIVQRLQNTPIIPGISANAIAIYQRGVQQGRNANYFLKVGDSNSESLGYLGLIGQGRYNLGQFAYLQTTIDFFRRTGNSFSDLTQVAQTGNLTTTIIDPIFSQPVRCDTVESPLQCEIRVKNPSIAFIYLGAADNQLLSVEAYYNALRSIVQTCIDNNVMPILTTMPTKPHPVRPQSFGLNFNNVILQVGGEFDIPVLNMWLATQGMPENGLQSDLLHFTITSNYRFVDFRGDQSKTGYTAWNLYALQMLDAVRKAVGGA
jgi:uncharacterized protein YraI